jgi:hypothetical protein
LYWIGKCYHTYSLKRIQPGEKRLLILDGHGSHISLEFTQFCDAPDIVLFCLPAQTTHLRQPLDVGHLYPLETVDGKFVEDYSLATRVGIRHERFLPIYKKARKASLYTGQ